MKVLVFGAGAIGCLLSAFLARAHDVTLIGRPAVVAQIQRDGLRIEGQHRLRAKPNAQADLTGLPAQDLVLVAVKSFDLDLALDQLGSVVGPKTVLLTLQNGLGNLERAEAAYPLNTVLAASVLYGARVTAPGVVVSSGPGELSIGGRAATAAHAALVVQALVDAGINARTTDNIHGALWMKAIVNAAINPLTALARVENGRLLQDPDLRQRMRRAAEEAARVAKAEGMRLPAADAVKEVERVARLTSTNRSSMLQSVDKGAPLELESITGAILAAARRHGIACPENEALYRQVKALGLPTVR